VTLPAKVDNCTGPGTEPWMRATHAELDVVRRAVVHAIELAVEDMDRWCASLSAAEMFQQPSASVPSVAFQLRHMARSSDRLLTYTEGRALSAEQLSKLDTEAAPDTAAAVLKEFHAGMKSAMMRVEAFEPAQYELARGVGRAKLPSTVGALLIHLAEHLQRHVGQAITTAKVISAQRV
jgi:uncharacterized damage-inducible protein DinB